MKKRLRWPRNRRVEVMLEFQKMFFAATSDIEREEMGGLVQDQFALDEKKFVKAVYEPDGQAERNLIEAINKVEQEEKDKTT